MIDMRIVHFNTNDRIGGAAIAAMRLRDGQRALGAEATLLVGDQSVPDPFTLQVGPTWAGKLRFLWERVNFLFHEKSKRERFAFSPWLVGPTLDQQPQILQADILHFHWINFGFLSPNQFQKLVHLKKPIFITLHDMWWITGGCHHAGDCEGYTRVCGQCEPYLRHPGPNDVSHRQWQRKKDLLAGASVHWIACSEWLAKRIRASSLGKDFPVNVLPNPLDMNIFTLGDKANARKALGLSPEVNYVLAVAAKVEVLWKGIDLLIQASHAFPPNTQLLVVGQMEDATAEQMGVPVHRVGVVQEPTRMAQLYQASDVFVISSRFENLPNTLMEAMGCGLPCVGFETGGIPEMIEHGMTGYVAIPFQASDLAQGVAVALKNASNWGEAGHQKAQKQYKKEVVVQQMLDLYASRLPS